MSPPVAAIIHIHHRHFIITQPRGWYSFYHPTEGRRLSRPRHCSKGAQPVPKAVYRSGCRDKHNRRQWDLNLGPFTPQSDVLTTRPLRPAKVVGVLEHVYGHKMATVVNVTMALFAEPYDKIYFVSSNLTSPRTGSGAIRMRPTVFPGHKRRTKLGLGWFVS